MINKCFCLFALLISCANAYALTPVTLKNGVNQLDINQDGLKDYVVLAQFDNNTSHPNLGLTFFIHRPDGGYSIMPVTNSSEFTWFDYRLSASADFLVQDNRLFKIKKHYYLVTARKTEEDLFDVGKVSLTIYRFKVSRDDPGVPLYEWSMSKTVTAQRSYQSADEAYQEVDEAMLTR
ncbi:CpmJ protein [Prodigiosinella confusarubida]|uniref:CpmJ protein n=1 Tax=Serratia sp. (strain ATCC 39006) TaxID=104623 RepID=A0A2I5TIL4_SERS3|nr:hypothetical protein [Serratia sp. ATCC 39006]AUH00098.1 CpmJ protein [Serratia sp. ATCC 39006]AUH04417.1 CpmJ protein [Serratia sp. ATCC 39006]